MGKEYPQEVEGIGNYARDPSQRIASRELVQECREVNGQRIPAPEEEEVAAVQPRGSVGEDLLERPFILPAFSPFASHIPTIP
ncbi:MAG: hypothetical protein ACE5JO_09510 [Candidatus Binatia bacterium]